MTGPLASTELRRFSASHSFLQRLRTSEGQRRRHGSLAPEPTRAPPAVQPVRHRCCQYPMWANGMPAPRRGAPFCDAPVIPGTSWCAKHHAIVFVPPFMSGEDDNGP